MINDYKRLIIQNNGYRNRITLHSRRRNKDFNKLYVAGIAR